MVAVALLGAGCKSSSEVTTSSVGESSAQSPTAVPETTSTPEPAETPTAAPEATPTTPAVKPTTAPEDTPTTPPATPPPEERDLASIAPDVFGSRAFGGDLSTEELSCATQRLAADPKLLNSVLDSVDPLTLPLEDQADLAIIAFDCAPDAFAAEVFGGLAVGAEDAIPPAVLQCLVDAVGGSGPDRRDLVLGFAALGAELPVPPAAQEAVVDTMVICLPGEVFADAVVGSTLGDPTVAAGLDIACIETTFDGELMRPVWTALVNDPAADFEDLPPQTIGPMLDAVLSCLSFGRIIAAETALQGVTLSESTIQCIDNEISQLDLAGSITGDTPPPGFESALLGCLTTEELLAIGGL